MGHYAFKLPDVGEGIAEAEIVAWHVRVGDRVAEDQPLVDVMTDKATVEITSPVAGVVLSTAGDLGEQAAIGSVLVVFDAEGFETSEVSTNPPVRAPPKAQEPAALPPPLTAAEPRPRLSRTEPALTTPKSFGEKPMASPAVRHRALEAGVPLQFVAGSGPAGRISMADLEGYLLSPNTRPTPAGRRRREGVAEVKIIGLRRRIAEKMALSKQRIPHYSYIEEVDVTELEALRGKLNDLYGPRRPKLTVLPFLVRALVLALLDFPQINATYDDEAGVVHRYAAVHVGIATQTPGGLMVPVIRNAEALSLWGAAAEIIRLAEAARSGGASREELTGSTITLTSLGILGGVSTTPVINYPEVAIVGPNKIAERPVVLKGSVVVRTMMNLSSSFDHRVVDGYDAAAFIQRLKSLLETPALLFVEDA